MFRRSASKAKQDGQGREAAWGSGMVRNVAAMVCALLALAGAGRAGAEEAAGEAVALQRQIEAACWPGDIARLGERLLEAFPQAAEAASARDARDRAREALRVLGAARVPLTRSAFREVAAVASQAPDLHRAALGDADAALRIAQCHRVGGECVSAVEGTPDGRRRVHWLQYAAALGSDAAAYDLAVHFRTEGQPALAAVYESRAIALGYQPPASLDHLRK